MSAQVDPIYWESSEAKVLRFLSWASSEGIEPDLEAVAEAADLGIREADKVLETLRARGMIEGGERVQ